MTLDEEREYIESRFQDNWAGATPISWENFPFRPASSDTEWVEFQVLHGTEQNISIETTPKYRRSGFININVYVLKDTGASRIRTLVANAAAIFRNADFNGVQCYAAEITSLGDSDRWYKYNISIQYYTDN